jgi:hypothetical protein
MLAGAWLIARASWPTRPTRTTPHCRRCAYPLPHEPLAPVPRCPECGDLAPHHDALFRPRRHRRGLVAATLLALAALALWRTPDVRADGAWGILPLDVRLAAVRLLGPSRVQQIALSIERALVFNPRASPRHLRGYAHALIAHPDDPLFGPYSPITLPRAWPVGVPLRIAPGNLAASTFDVRIARASTILNARQPAPTAEQRSEPLEDQPASDILGNNYASYYQWWIERTTPIDANYDQHVRRFDIAPIHIDAAGRALELSDLASTLNLSVPAADSIADIRLPLSPAASDALLRQLRITIIQFEDRGPWGITTQFFDADASIPETTVAALRLTILFEDTPVAVARWRQRPGESLVAAGTPAPLLPPDSTLDWHRLDPARPSRVAFPADLTHPGYAVLITHDDELSACDFNATHRWAGDVRLPLTALLPSTDFKPD